MRSLVLVSLLVTAVASCKDSGTNFTFDSGPVSGDAGSKVDAGGDSSGTDAPKVDGGGDTIVPPNDSSVTDVGADQVALDVGADLPSADAPADLAVTSDGADDGATTGDAE